jgi:hypothetical protein
MMESPASQETMDRMRRSPSAEKVRVDRQASPDLKARLETGDNRERPESQECQVRKERPGSRDPPVPTERKAVRDRAASRAQTPNTGHFEKESHFRCTYHTDLVPAPVEMALMGRAPVEVKEAETQATIDAAVLSNKLSIHLSNLK